MVGNVIHNLMAGRKAVLFDFDGPICDVFAGYRAETAAHEVRSYLSANTERQIPGVVMETADPFEVMRYSLTLGPTLSSSVERVLSGIELRAIELARPTRWVDELMANLVDRGIELAIVSNNGQQAVAEYTKNHGLPILSSRIFARTPETYQYLKPHPYLINAALTALHVGASEAIMVGDSPSDVLAARAANTAIIGYANKAHKLRSLAGADAVVESLAIINSAR